MGLPLLSLCTGLGSLDLGIGLAVPRVRPVAYVENEATVLEALGARFLEGTLPFAPVWDDVRTFAYGPASELLGRVGIVSAGFPCQPHSVQGLQEGEEDARWIWPNIVDVLRVVRPGVVFLENVPGLSLSGLGRVLGDLHECGYDAEWDVYRASDLGYPHYRARLFILAIGRDLPDAEGRTLREFAKWIEPGSPLWGDAESGGLREADRPLDLAVDDGEGRELGGSVGEGSELASGGDPDGRRSEVGGELTREFPSMAPPGPDDDARWAPLLEGRKDLAPVLPESHVRGMAHGASVRLERLRAEGNSVVPLVAAYGLVDLARRFARVRGYSVPNLNT